MVIYNQFFDNTLLTELLQYAKKANYTKVEDGTYNFKQVYVEGELFKKVEKTFLENNIKDNIEILRIQCIDSSITVAEKYHKHNTKYKVNIVCFLNDSFEGGEFEYIEGITKIVKPTPNTALIFESELAHRVFPVVNGNRYTLVAFLTENLYNIKQQKTLI